MKDRGLKMILDFVPNHSSDEHEWFQKSVNREEPYTDFYVWKKGGGKGSTPNNWVRHLLPLYQHRNLRTIRRTH
jgi:alpha-glucosidase